MSDPRHYQRFGCYGDAAMDRHDEHEAQYLIAEEDDGPEQPRCLGCGTKDEHMTSAQRAVLRELSGHHLFPGYCELMLQTGLKSYTAVDWVLNALERRGLIVKDQEDYVVTDAGRSALQL